ncbi:AAA family ATPase [Actinotalea sp. M2MS4P-6]|uniref:AAA family ATPase n=1 Tax=Actinotalea sp. M2MS4P-6 TaxID=2983762 RepID=UPI0021E4A8F0|nr:AAA family ATPase [Actinotalea sp. M2MS4P-6]MCV2395329.1 AAA family ATPase [Actinotalea sp. M2MS4P-6]
MRPILISLGGLPGVGKTTLAREISRSLGATHLRVDSVEQALLSSGRWDRLDDLADLGYRALHAVAADQLRLGLSVVADTVNPIPLTRDAWHSVAGATDARLLEVEVVCSDPGEHRRRVERRTADIAGHALPTWAEVEARTYHPWPGALRVDTAVPGAADDVLTAVRALG